MVSTFLPRPAFTRPVAGSKVVFAGNSIFDITIPYGQATGIVAARYGWVKQGETLITNGSAETNILDWQAETNCTLSQDATSAQVGTHSAMLAATAAGVVIANVGGGPPASGTPTVTSGAVASIAVAVASADYQVAPLVTVVPKPGFGGTGAAAHATINAAGQVTGFVVDAGGTGYTAGQVLVLCSGMRPTSAQATFATAGVVVGGTYTFSLYAKANAGSGIATAGYFLQVVFQDGAGNLTTASGASSTVTGSFVRLSLTYTVPAGCIACWLRVVATATVAGQVLRMDGAMLVAGSALTPYTDWRSRAAIGGATVTNVQNTAAEPSLLGNYAARIGAYTPDVVVFNDGINDLAFASSGYAGAAVTLAQYTSAWQTILAGMAALSPVPRVVVLGIGNFYPGAWGANATLPPTWARDYPDAADQMDAAVAGLCAQRGALFVPVRSYMQIGLMQTNDVHPTPGLGQEYLADRVIAALEGGL